VCEVKAKAYMKQHSHLKYSLVPPQTFLQKLRNYDSKDSIQYEYLIQNHNPKNSRQYEHIRQYRRHQAIEAAEDRNAGIILTPEQRLGQMMRDHLLESGLALQYLVPILATIPILVVYIKSRHDAYDFAHLNDELQGVIIGGVLGCVMHLLAPLWRPAEGFMEIGAIIEWTVAFTEAFRAHHYPVDLTSVTSASINEWKRDTAILQYVSLAAMLCTISAFFTIVLAEVLSRRGHRRAARN